MSPLLTLPAELVQLPLELISYSPPAMETDEDTLIPLTVIVFETTSELKGTFVRSMKEKASGTLSVSGNVTATVQSAVMGFVV